MQQVDTVDVLSEWILIMRSMKPKAHSSVITNSLVTACSDLTGDGLSWYKPQRESSGAK